MNTKLVGFYAGYMEKTGGLMSEYLGVGLNPANVVGNPLGLIASLFTEKRGPAEQKRKDKDMWKNILIPGWASYNIGKRVGSSRRVPKLTDEEIEDQLKRIEMELKARQKGMKDREIAKVIDKYLKKQNKQKKQQEKLEEAEA